MAAVTLAVFVGPWLVWCSRIAQAHGVIGWHLPLGIALWSITPVLAVAVLATGGMPSLRELGRRIVRWRVSGRCYLFAILTPPLIATVTVVITAAADVPLRLGHTLSASGAAIYFIYGTGLFLLTEEAGWRGVVLPQLQSRFGPLVASLVLGFVWAVWHIPSLHVPGEADRGLSLPVFAVLVIATSVLITALVNAAHGSVLIAALFHASFDASYSFTGVVGGDRALLWVATALTAAAAVTVTVRTSGNLCYRVGQQRPTSGMLRPRA
jgi:CAAX protease family protein